MENDGFGQRLLRFAEQPLLWGPLGIVGGLVGLFFYTPILILCGICVLLAFQRAGVVSGKQKRKQAVAYFALIVTTTAILYGMRLLIKTHAPDIGKDVANEVIKALSEKRSTPLPAKESNAEPESVTSASPRSTEKVTASLPHKVPPPRSPIPEPLPKGAPRLGIGPEAYKDIDDAQVGQWAIEEADKIEDLAHDAMKSSAAELGGLKAARWFFTTKFKDCCAQDVQELRTEILRRLGPPAKDPDEISAWTMLFPQTKYAGAPETINPMSVTYYAPYLRRLGLQLKRRQIPRRAPKALQFSEVQVPPDALNHPYNIVVTIKTETAVSAGYLVVEFDGHPARIACDFVDSKLVIGSDAAKVDNKEVREYAGKYDPPNYALAIGKTPFTPEKPVHVIASGGSKPFHVAKVTLFDE